MAPQVPDSHGVPKHAFLGTWCGALPFAREHADGQGHLRARMAWQRLRDAAQLRRVVELGRERFGGASFDVGPTRLVLLLGA